MFLQSSLLRRPRAAAAGRTARTRRHEGQTNIGFVYYNIINRIIIHKFKSSGGARLQLAALLGEQLPPLLVDLRTRADSIINNLIILLKILKTALLGE